MKTELNRTISTIQDADLFIRELFNNGELFHFRDNTKEYIYLDGTTVSCQEAELFMALLGRIYDLEGYDPFAKALLYIQSGAKTFLI